MTKVVIAPPAYRVVKTSTGYKLVAAATQGPPGAGRIPGGSAAQVLRKASGADYDVEWHSLAKADVGLANVDNTSDVNKPVSTLQAAAIATAISQLVAGAGPAYDTLVELQNIILADETAASALAALVATKVAKAGDTMTGSLLATDGVPDLGDATHRFRDGYFSGTLSLAGVIYSGSITVQYSGNRGIQGLQGGAPRWRIDQAQVLTGSGGVFGWGNSSTDVTTVDTGFSRISAGVAGLGNGVQGNTSGSLQLSSLTAGNNVNLSAGGSATANAVKWASEASLWTAGVNNFTLNMGNSGAGTVFAFTLNANTGLYKLEGRSAAIIGWNASTIGTGATDVALSRISAGKLGLGTGAQGDFGGTLKLLSLEVGSGIIGSVYGPTGAASRLILGNDVGLENQASARPIGLHGDVVNVKPGASLGWARAGQNAWSDTSPDLTLFKDAADTMAQRRGVNPQTSRVYNTYTDSANYERVSMGWGITANVFVMKFEAAGTGSTNRGFVIDGVGGGITIQTNSSLTFRGGPSANHQLIFAGASNLFGPSQWDNNIDLGSSSFRWRDAYIGRDAKISGVAVLGPYTVATVPSAAAYTRGIIWVSDESTGACHAYSDGTNWRRLHDKGIIS